MKKLDSDMQMLVYENYNKFISATDTIRKMAQNVEGMETEMADLKTSMDRIASSSATVNTSLEGETERKSQVAQLNRICCCCCCHCGHRLRHVRRAPSSF